MDAQVQSEIQSVPSKNELTVKTSGTVQGAWLKSDGGSLGLVSVAPQGPSPYLCFYRDGASIPYAMHFEKGQLYFQIPGERSSEPTQIVPVSQVREALEALKAAKREALAQS